MTQLQLLLKDNLFLLKPLQFRLLRFQPPRLRDLFVLRAVPLVHQSLLRRLHACELPVGGGGRLLLQRQRVLLELELLPLALEAQRRLLLGEGSGLGASDGRGGGELGG